jgi:hypothetical protein
VAWRYTALGRRILMSDTLLYLATAFGVIVISLYLLTFAVYLIYPNYVDHGQPTVASIGWLGTHGQSIYPDWVKEDVYGVQYGPVLYLINGLVLALSPTLAASKLAGVLCLIAAFCLTSIVIKKLTNNTLATFFVLSSFVMLCVPFGPYPYWNRAEPILMFISAFSLLIAFELPPLAAATVIGVLAGLATGLKLHGLIYVAPTAVVAFARAESQRERIAVAIVGVACAIVVVFLPFFSKQASVEGYLRYLIISTHHGMSPFLILQNLQFALLLVIPIIALWFWRRPALNPPELWMLAVLGTSIAITVVIAGKPGAGPHHLLPFVPLCLYAIIISVGAPTAESRAGAIMFIFVLLVFGPDYIVNTRYTKSLFLNSRAERDKIAELGTYLKAFPEAQIGVSDDEHYSDTFYRIFSVLDGRPLHVDFAAWMDLQYGGVPEKHIIRFLKGCEVPIWILPLGTPFSKISWYTNLPMLSEDFRRTFSTNYREIEIGQAWQVWGCRSPANIAE